MKGRVRQIWSIIAAIGVVAMLVSCNRRDTQNARSPLTIVRYGVSPFQDRLLPIVGEDNGWYLDVGLDVQFKFLGWTEVMESLSAGRIDVAINNESSVVGTHPTHPDIIYWYGLNPLDDGFALMIRPGGPLKTVHEIEKQVGDHDKAVRMTATQLKGKTIITTSATDMEQAVAAAVRRAGLSFANDVKIINLDPEAGLAAFRRGQGDAYIGGIPQRSAATTEGMVEMLKGSDLGPAPIKGIVTTKKFATEHQAALVGLLHVWFETVNYINADMLNGAAPIIAKLSQSPGGKVTFDDFKRFWNVSEHYPASAQVVQDLILDPKGRNYLRARWNDCNAYFVEVTKTIPSPVAFSDAVWMDRAQNAYVAKYGLQ
jgi:ABC-type nitrate/sulfonate/bicarbonate transport system substrate-binding protein